LIGFARVLHEFENLFEINNDKLSGDSGDNNGLEMVKDEEI